MNLQSISTRYKGILIILCADFLWAIGGSLAKYLFQLGLAPTDLVQARATYSLFILAPILLLFKRDILLIERRDIGYFMILGICGLAAVQFTYFFAISKIDVGVAITIQYTAPAIIVLYNLLFLKEPITLKIFCAIILALIGCYLVVGVHSVDLEELNKLGIGVAFCSSFIFAFYTIFSKKGLAKYDAWTVFFYVILFASLFWNIAHPPLVLIGQGYSWSIWGWVIALAITSTLIPFALFFVGLKLLDPVTATITSTMEPIFAIILAYLVLGERLDGFQIIGGLLIIGSVILMSLKKGKA